MPPAAHIRHLLLPSLAVLALLPLAHTFLLAPPPVFAPTPGAAAMGVHAARRVVRGGLRGAARVASLSLRMADEGAGGGGEKKEDQKADKVPEDTTKPVTLAQEGGDSGAEKKEDKAEKKEDQKA
eukprot:CAMPEP_0173380218 /NCGR_PEP_ID=MMETSP1356-20130122/2946_1 /TAXON_ID=77927 ORGANISM="Hemiselmis virescens, Strain PCC157" /NCGR_SAMPLE_ID=MMETSP1356 /ASSEMBLY_ACC=CAM_ASM_000847 /LENGTH=124 /DNA_ID=CAMNT_0014333737 /DNA_START=68 /DNA_END=439 /DNA_ORIENTATION=+